MHIKVEVGPVSFGGERTVTGEQSQPEWRWTGGWKGIEGSGGQVGVGGSVCAGEVCRSFEYGIEAGKVVNDTYQAAGGWQHLMQAQTVVATY